MEWNTKSVLSLIELYHSRRELWDATHPDYKNRCKRNQIWSNISSTIGVERADVERKMRSIIGQFQREVRRIAYSKKFSGTGEGVYHCKWFAFKSLTFLLNRKQPEQLFHVSNNEDNVTPSTQAELQEIEILGTPKRPAVALNTANVTVASSKLEKDVMKHALPYPKKRPAEVKLDGIIKDVYKSVKVMRDRGEFKQERDEFSIFGEHVACKIRQLPTKYARSTVEHQINTILYQADLGHYDKPESNNAAAADLACTSQPSASSTSGFVKVEDLSDLAECA